MGYYPIMIDLTRRQCVVVGGGAVGARKARALAEAGANVVVIAPDCDASLESAERVTLLRRDYRPGDLAGAALAFAASDDRSVNAAVASEARALGIPVNVADDPELCSFIVPSVVRRGDLVIAVSTSGRSPALCKIIRKQIEAEYGPEYAGLLTLMSELRGIVKAQHASHHEREDAFSRLLDCGVLELLREGRAEEARERALECIS